MFSTLRFFEGFCLAGIILTLYALRRPGRGDSPRSSRGLTCVTEKMGRRAGRREQTRLTYEDRLCLSCRLATRPQPSSSFMFKSDAKTG
uniref:Solute carrier family 22 member 23 n=2 Tax=Molossus molossus TaxID=27622 RepID=A0A7J8FBV9_MOLMO|nr:solute carrier family 22 member 23 [Molossus molossus]